MYMKGRRWRMTWKRFPTTGQPGGPDAAAASRAVAVEATQLVELGTPARRRTLVTTTFIGGDGLVTAPIAGRCCLLAGPPCAQPGNCPFQHHCTFGI